MASRIWSINPAAADPASTLLEHTAELGLSSAKISSIDVNAAGELVVVDLLGNIYVIARALA